MDSFEEQLKCVWLLSIGEDGSDGSGGALCYSEDGHLITARHVVEGIGDSLKIKGRRYNSAKSYKIEYLFDYKTLDLAILKIKKSGKKFPFKSLNPEIRLDQGEALVCHGHGADIPFSSRFGKTTYPYQPCNDIANRFCNLDRTLEGANDVVLAIFQRNYPTPLFRTLARVINKKDANNVVKQLHPYLPLIEQDEACPPGFSGCPVFRVANDDVVGIYSCYDNCGYIVPAQVICYAIQHLSGLTI